MTGMTGSVPPNPLTFRSPLIQGCYDAEGTFYYVNGNSNPCKLPVRTEANPLGPTGPTGSMITEMLCPNGISYMTTESNIIGSLDSTGIRPCTAADGGIPQTISLLIPSGNTGIGNYGLTYDTITRNAFYGSTSNIACNSLKWEYTGPNGKMKALGQDLYLTGTMDTIVASQDATLVNGMVMEPSLVAPNAIGGTVSPGQTGLTGTTGTNEPTLEDLQKWIYVPTSAFRGRLCLTTVDNTCLTVGMTGINMVNTLSSPYPPTGANDLNWELRPRKGGLGGSTNPSCSAT